MSGLGLTLILLAAVLHASWNLVSKQAAHLGYFFVFAHRIWSTVIYLPWIVYLLTLEHLELSPAVIVCLVATSILHLVYSLALLRGYQQADLSIVYPVARGSGPLLTSIAAVILFNESLNITEAAGIVCICGGVLLIAIRDKLRGFFSQSSWPGIRWGMIIGVLIAAYSLVDAFAVKTLLIAPVIVNWVSSLGGFFILLPKMWPERTRFRRQMKGHWYQAAFVGIAAPLAYILILYVLQLGAHVSMVAPLRELSMVVAAIAGYFILGERIKLSGWLGCATMVLGVVLISI